jgi:CRP-like cAMP-binding protein
MYVYAGLVRCELPGAAGNLKICFYAHKETIFAEGLVFQNLPSVSIFTASEDSIIYAFPAHIVRDEIIPRYPDLAFNLMQIMAHKLRLFSLHLECITLTDVCAQICKICYSILIEQGNTMCSPGIGQQELADFLGVHRNTIVRAIHRLKRDGIVKNLSRSSIEVSSLAALLERGGSG